MPAILTPIRPVNYHQQVEDEEVKPYMASNDDQPMRVIHISSKDVKLLDGTLPIENESLPLDFVKTRRLLSNAAQRTRLGCHLFTHIEPVFVSYAHIGHVEHMVEMVLSKRFVGKLDGVALAYGPVYTVDPAGSRVVTTQSGTFASVRTQFVVFRPKLGMILDGAINSVETNSISVLIHNFVNCRARLRLGNAADYDPRGDRTHFVDCSDAHVGQLVKLRVTKINVNKGILSIMADVVEVRNGTDTAYGDCPLLTTGGHMTPFALRNQPRRLLNESPAFNVSNVFSPRDIKFEMDSSMGSGSVVGGGDAIITSTPFAGGAKKMKGKQLDISEIAAPPPVFDLDEFSKIDGDATSEKSGSRHKKSKKKKKHKRAASQTGSQDGNKSPKAKRAKMEG